MNNEKEEISASLITAVQATLRLGDEPSVSREQVAAIMLDVIMYQSVSDHLDLLRDGFRLSIQQIQEVEVYCNRSRSDGLRMLAHQVERAHWNDYFAKQGV